MPRLCLPWSQIRDWDSKFWNLETFLRLKFKVFKPKTLRDSAKIVETKTCSRLSSISVIISPIAVPLQFRKWSHYSMIYFIVWSWLLVVRSRQITNYLTGQSRQGSNDLTGLSRQGSNYLTGLSRQIVFPFKVWLNNFCHSRPQLTNLTALKSASAVRWGHWWHNNHLYVHLSSWYKT